MCIRYKEFGIPAAFAFIEPAHTVPRLVFELFYFSMPPL